MQHRQAFHQVGQLAHVARPGIQAQGLQRLVGEAHFAAAGAGQLRGDGHHQVGQVVGALAQRGHLDGEHIQAVEQVLAEVTVGDPRFQVAVGGGDHAHIAADGLVAADAFEAALLQHAQQLDLHRQAHVADLVQQQGAAFGHLEAALARAQRTGERALFMAEQLAFQQVGRDGAAVDGHERSVAARRLVVDGARHHFLAGAGFAQHQHGGVEAGDLLDHAAQAGDCGAVAGGAAGRDLLGLVFGIQALEAGAAQAGFQLGMADRAFQRPHAGFVQAVRSGEGRRVAFQQQHRRGQLGLAQPGEEGVGGLLVVHRADDHRQPVVRTLATDIHVTGAGDPAGCQVHEFEQAGQAFGTRGVGVDDEDAGFTHGGGL